MKNILKAALLFAFIFGAIGVFAADSKDVTGTDDPILRALSMEMQRSKANLHLENMSTPYFIDYRVVDMDNWEADTGLGDVRSESRSRVRFLLVRVKLGDYKQDSSTTHAEGSVELVPLDGDEQAFRFQIWTATDKAYKQAAEALTEKQARLKQLTIDHPVDDFAHADPVRSVKPLVELKTDRVTWLKMLRDASGLYVGDPKVQFMGASLNFQAVNRYYLNSEGTAVRSGDLFYKMTIHCSTQADDGMQLELSTNFAANSEKDLPTASKFQERANSLLSSVKNLREAPLADEDYHGPVLLSATSASTVFSSLIGNDLLGNKPELGQNARVRGQFASSYKTRVLPEFLNMEDDPTLHEWDSTALLGHYEVDDEGVKAMRVPLVEKGVLVNYLLGRQPIRDFPSSNGHGRARLPFSWPSPEKGNLIVRSSEAATAEELKNKLIAMCKDRGLDYGYYVTSMEGPRAPRLLYRVWAKDGHEELVRGGLFGDLDERSMRSGIVAAGNDYHVTNALQAVPHSIVAPSVLFDDLEVKRQTSNKDKLPEYPAPEATKK